MDERDQDGDGEGGAAARRSVGARRNPASAEAILAAAGAVLAEGGYRGFTIEAVARRARAGKPTVYRWWPSRAALLLDVYHRQKREPEPDPAGTIEDELAGFLAHLLRFWREGPAGDVFRALVAEAQADVEARAALAAYTGERRRAFADLVERRRATGEIAADFDADLVWEAVVAFAWRRLLAFELGDDDEAAARRLVRLLAEGFRPR